MTSGGTSTEKAILGNDALALLAIVAKGKDQLVQALAIFVDYEPEMPSAWCTP